LEKEKMNLGCGPTCSCNKQAGMSGAFDFIASPVAAVVNGIFGIGAQRKQFEISKQQAGAQLKLAQTQAQSALTQEQFAAAVQAQQDAVDQSKAIRDAEILGLVLVGGAAVLISLYFIRSATKKGN
jgi:multidrug efflux pump subunit AcrA (membrane-fusion protein)